MENKEKVQVVIIAENQKNPQVLILQMNEKRSSFWQNVTGSVEPEDTKLLNAAKRELSEETNINNAKIRELDIQFKFIDQYNNHVIEYCFLAIIPSSEVNIVLDPGEHQNYRWVALNDVSKDSFTYESNFFAFEKAKEALNV